jgi:hypothetical protein
VEDRALFPAKGTTVAVEQGAKWAPGPVWTHFRLSLDDKGNIPLLSSP